jgi:hypothetical protein
VATTQLPNPSASTLGGVESAAAVSHEWIDSISTSGVPHLSQPAFTDISGTVAATQLPNPSASTLGGVESIASVSHNFLTAISTSGVPAQAQPAFTDISGALTPSQLSATGSTSNTFLGTLNGTSVVFNAITRSVVDATAKGWQFIGTATGATVTVGPVTTTGTFQQYMIKYIIKGYSGGTPVGRFQCANGTPSTTALTNSFSISEGVTAPTTGAGGTAIPGVPLAVTLSNIGRSGTIFIDGASGAIKVIDVFGNEGTPSVATAPTLFRGSSFFSDLSTNLPLKQFQLTVYDTLTAVAASTNTFATGTYLTVWGRNTD